MDMDERCEVREVCDLEVDYRSGATVDRALLHNVSTAGCMLELAGGLSGDVEFVSVKLGGLPVDGHIVWRRDPIVGVRFLQSVHPRVVEHLAFSPPEQDVRAA
jgi:hypothetical protein